MGDPEISDLHLPALADQQVPRLDIAVYQAGRVRGLQCSRGLGDQVHRSRWIHRPLIEKPGQRRPVDQFHHQIGRKWRVGLVVVVHVRDTRVRQ
jgi:hypothetical protein